MDQQEKDALLARAKRNLQKVRGSIESKIHETVEAVKNIKDKLSKLPLEEVPVQSRLLRSFSKRAEELGVLYPSPYFIKCEIRFDGESVSRIFYFSKFTFPEESIFSWTSPAATIRFEQPGKFSYVIKDFGNKTGEMLSKEQYMISGGNIIFMAAESLTQPRELIYQEYFSQRKSSFVLSEIVEQMEKAQDKVIRSNPAGSFLISGPAGSGKTTLALHRVAFLVQSPDTAEKFKENEIIVFVQDASTREYFGGLLPQLGIINVRITTFADWVREHLKLWDIKYTVRIGSTEQEKDLYEFEKYQAIKKSGNIKYDINSFKLLEAVYSKLFSPQSLQLFERQRKEKVFDRFDLTLLMKAYVSTNKGVFEEEIEYKQLKGGKVRRKKILTPIKYSLMILDEVQNYLPEQIQILRGCVNEQYHAIVYVGDLAQQTQLCTIRDWSQAEEIFNEDRKAVLQKNYRSTKQILEYLNKVGFATQIPEEIKQGPEVEERVFSNKELEIAYIKQVVEKNTSTVVGVMCKSKEYLEEFKFHLSSHNNVHLLSINEAQGVEFDVACLVGVNKELFAVDASYSDALAVERKRVDRDLLYVALTRAMNELHVVGNTNIKEIL